MANCSIEISNLIKIYNNQRIPKSVFNEFNAFFESGKIHCLVGISGCGKSTLLKIIAGLDTFNNGDIKFGNGNDVLSKSIIFQENNLLPWKTVYDNILFILKNYYNQQHLRKTKEELNEEINNVLEKYGVLNYKDYHPFELSGGLRQKITFAKVLITHPQIVLLDEPFSALDWLSKIKIHETFLENFTSRQFTSILTTHDISEAIKLGDYIHIIKNNEYIKVKNTLKKPREKDENYNAFLDKILKIYSEGI